MKSIVCRPSVVTLLALTTSTLVAGAVMAPGAAAVAPPPDNPVDRAVLDVAQVVWPVPEDYQYDFTVQERVEGLLGINDFPGGPLGSFPQPPSSTDPETMPGSPGTGYPATITDVTGLNPRPPADESSDASREMYGSGGPAAPCDGDTCRALSPLNHPPTPAIPAVAAADTTASDGDPLDALAPVAGLLFGTEETTETVEGPVEYVPPADPPASAA